ncbi:MAG: hypothetical protein ABUL72_05630, partial [Armatimonadota bacterium]
MRNTLMAGVMALIGVAAPCAAQNTPAPPAQNPPAQRPPVQWNNPNVTSMPGLTHLVFHSPSM